MSMKTRGTVILVCGIIGLISDGIRIAMQLLGGTGMNTWEIINLVVAIALGIYLCWLGAKWRKADK